MTERLYLWVLGSCLLAGAVESAGRARSERRRFRSATIIGLVLVGVGPLTAGAASSVASQTVPTFTLANSLGGAFNAAASVGDTVWTGEGVAVVQWRPNSTWYDRTRTVALDPGAAVRSVAALDGVVFAGTDTGLYQVEPDSDTANRHYRTPGPVVGLAAGGEWLVIADRVYGYLVARVGAEATVVAGLPLDGGAYGAPALGGMLAALPGPELVGVSLDGVPSLRFRLDLGGEVVGVAVGDAIVYASVAGVGLVVVDITDPSYPQVLASLQGIPSGDLELAGGNLWVIGTEVRLLDVTEPGAPLDVFDGPGPYAPLAGASDVHQSGDRLVATMGDSVVFTDVASPLEPRRLAQSPATWPVVGAGASLGHALLAKGPTGLDIVRMGTDSGFVAGYGPPGGVMGAAADGALGFLSTGAGAQLVELDQPGDPVLGPVFGPDWTATPWMAVSDRVVAQVTPGELRLATRDGESVRDAGDLVFQDMPDWPTEAVVQGISLVPGAAYLAAGGAGVAVVDIRNADRPRTVRWVPVDGQVSAVTSSGNRLVAGTDDGWAVLDIDDVLAPIVRTRTKTGAGVHGLSLVGSRLTVGDELMLREVDLGDAAGLERTLTSVAPVRMVVPHAESVIAVTEDGVIEVVRADESAHEPGTPTPPATLSPWVSPTPTATREPTAKPSKRTSWLPRVVVP